MRRWLLQLCAFVVLFALAGCGSNPLTDNQDGAVDRVSDPSLLPGFANTDALFKVIADADIPCILPSKLRTDGDKMQCELRVMGERGEYYKSISFEVFNYNLPKDYDAAIRDRKAAGDPYGAVVGKNWQLACGSRCDDFASATGGVVLTSTGQIPQSFMGPAPENLDSPLAIVQALIANGFPCRLTGLTDDAKFEDAFCELPWAGGAPVLEPPYDLPYAEQIGIYFRSTVTAAKFRNTRRVDQDWGQVDSTVWWINCGLKIDCEQIAKILSISASRVYGN